MSSTSNSFSGIVTTQANERIIPASRRPDGSLRPERRVREGFTPLEDVARYKNTKVAAAEEAEARYNLLLHAKAAPPPKTKAQIKNEKRKAKKRADKRATSEHDEHDQLEHAGAEQGDVSEELSNELDKLAIEVQKKDQKSDVGAIQKRIKAIEKKIRQAEQLKERLDAGNTSLNVEQLGKINRLPEFNDELRRLKDEEAVALES